jgi:tetratricopeptide (TPR) repeat protein
MEQQGLKALADFLPDVAASRFQSALAEKELTVPDQMRIRLLLAESLIRSNQPDEATKILDDPSLKDQASALFWEAQALRAQGKFAEAIALFDLAIGTKNFPYYGESVITRSRLLSALGSHRDAIAGLNLLTSSKSPLAIRAKLDQTHLLCLTGKYPEARKVLPALKSLRGNELLEARLLDGKLLQAESQFTKATALFTAILQEFKRDAETLPPIIHPAVIGQARAMASLNRRADAADVILAFVQAHPTSPELADAFVLLHYLQTNVPTAEDPVQNLIQQRLTDWSNTPIVAHSPMIADPGDSAISSYPLLQELDHPELHAQALYTRILALAGAKEPEQCAQLRQLATQLNLLHPGHSLATAATIELARNEFQNQQSEKARNLLDSLLSLEQSSDHFVAVNLLLADECFEKKDFVRASLYFEKAAARLSATPRSSALFNAGISSILVNDDASWDRLLKESSPKLSVSLTLERALHTIKQSPEAAMPLLEKFIIDQPQHARIGEARLAMAYCALKLQRPDLSMAKAQLDSINATVVSAESLLATKILLAQAQQDQNTVITLSRSFIAQYPDSPAVAEMTLNLGMALYQNGDMNDARQVLQKLEKSHPAQAGPSLLIAARAAARTGTPQSLTEAISIFDKIITADSPLSAFAVLEKARTLIDAKSPSGLVQAREELQKLFYKIAADSPLHTPTGLLLIEILYAQGGSDSTQYEASLKVQDVLLEKKQTSTVETHRIHYYRGLTLEQLNKPDEALDVYYQVIESASKEAPADWDYFERCGFNAIALLEKSERWESAIALAKKLSSYPTPRANEAAERAKNLGLEHMIMDE